MNYEEEHHEPEFANESTIMDESEILGLIKDEPEDNYLTVELVDDYFISHEQDQDPSSTYIRNEAERSDSSETCITGDIYESQNKAVKRKKSAPNNINNAIRSIQHNSKPRLKKVIKPSFSTAPALNCQHFCFMCNKNFDKKDDFFNHLQTHMTKLVVKKPAPAQVKARRAAKIQQDQKTQFLYIVPGKSIPSYNNKCHVQQQKINQVAKKSTGHIKKNLIKKHKNSSIELDSKSIKRVAKKSTAKISSNLQQITKYEDLPFELRKLKENTFLQNLLSTNNFCSICKIYFKSKANCLLFAQHIRYPVHVRENCFVCHLCPMEYQFLMSRTRFKEHTKISHPQNKIFQCPEIVCMDCFNNEEDFKKHRELFHSEDKDKFSNNSQPQQEENCNNNNINSNSNELPAKQNSIQPLVSRLKPRGTIMDEELNKFSKILNIEIRNEGDGDDGTFSPDTQINNNEISGSEKRKRKFREAFLCDFCDHLFDSLINLRGHVVKDHLALKEFKCNFCYERFNTQPELKEHERTHKAPVICEICGRSFIDLTKLKSHQKRYHRDRKELECLQCKTKFWNKMDYNVHMNIHMDPKKYKFSCDQCHKKFSQSTYWKSHMLTHMNEEDVHKMKNNTASVFVCDICKKIFPYQSALDDHIRLHTKETPFHCQHCEKSYRAKYLLMHHTKLKHPELYIPIRPRKKSGQK